MKRLIALLLCALLLVPALGSVASAAGQTGMEAYIDTNGRAVCVVNGTESVLPFSNVQSIVRVTDTAVFLTAGTMEGALALFMWSPVLSARDSSILISAVAGEPVYVAHDDVIYFLNPDNTRQLMKCDTSLSPQSSVVRLLPSANCELREAMDGLNISLVSDGAVYYSRILDAATGMLRVTQFDPEANWKNFGDFETQITSEGGLELRRRGDTAWRFVSYDNVTAQAADGGKLYYLMQALNGSTWLACYDPADTNSPLTYLNRIDRSLQPTLLVGDGLAFVIDNLGTVQAFEPGTTRSAGSWNAYAQDADMTLCAGKLLVYGTQNGARGLRLKVDPTAANQPAPTQSQATQPWSTQRPYVNLVTGSRGEDVRALQERLNELGYSAGRADGVFGANTRTAVIYFQDALGLAQDGVASPELQRRLFAANAPAFEEYVELAPGGRTGIRVRKLQDRLRELGYQADAADGVYGGRTKTAVALFQRENGLRSTGVATVETQRRLMSPYAAVCSSYILLRKGDTGVRVIELQERLIELGYMIGEASGEFDDKTVEVVHQFCLTNGLRDSTQADETIQALLFSRNALPNDGYITLMHGDKGEPVRNLQSRLAQLGYYDGELNGDYRSSTRNAVRLFQKNNQLEADGVAGVLTQERLYSPWAVPYWGGDTEPDPTPVPPYGPTAEPPVVPTPGPDEQNIDDADLEKMIQWMNENYRGYWARDEWDPISFVEWLQTSLYLEGFMPQEDYDLRQEGIYDLATRKIVEKFQRYYEIGKDVKDYPYGVADAETLQMIWDVTPSPFRYYR